MANRTRIMYVATSMNTGGIESLLMNIMRKINKDEFAVFFLCYGDEPFMHENEINSLGGRILRLKDVKEVGARQHIREIRALLREHQIDVVHAHVYLNSMFSLVAAKLEGVRGRIVHSHNTKKEKPNSIGRFAYVLAAKTIISLYATERLACGVEAGKVFFGGRHFEVINNGIVKDTYVFNEAVRDEVRQELHISKDAKVFMNASRFEHAKNHKYLIEIFEAYLTEDPTSVLLLPGSGSLLDEAKLQVSTLNIEKNVLFLGNRSDMNRIYNAADAFVMPSYNEGLPVALVEAQVNGLACVVSTGVPEEADISGNMVFLSLENTESWVKQLSLAARRTDQVPEDVYSISTTVQRLEAIYEKYKGSRND